MELFIFKKKMYLNYDQHDLNKLIDMQIREEVKLNNNTGNKY